MKQKLVAIRKLEQISHFMYHSNTITVQEFYSNFRAGLKSTVMRTPFRLLPLAESLRLHSLSAEIFVLKLHQSGDLCTR